jgi:hypothetical protein
MTFTVAALLGGFVVLISAIAGLLVQRRVLRESLQYVSRELDGFDRW